MHFVLVTGLSGAGRSVALKRLEDNGYFCVDNLPPALISDFVNVCCTKQQHIENVAVVVDIRAGIMLDDIYHAIDKLKEIENINFEILYLDANVEALVRRFQQTRRLHPLDPENLLNGIAVERKKLRMLYDMSSSVIDTSNFSVKQLNDAIDKLFGLYTDNKLIIKIITFGFKHGTPLDADMVFDMRFISNPYYVDELRNQTGLDEAVKKYVLSFPRTLTFINTVSRLVMQLAPYYYEQDKRSLTIAFGCTGGRHRSVVVAEELFKILKSEGYNVNIEHRNVTQK